MERIRQQKIPTLVDLLKTAEKYNKSVIFDLRKPPANHAYNSRYINLTVETILNSTINPELVLWLHDEDREKVVQMAPGFQQIFGGKDGPVWDKAQRINFPYNNISAEKIEDYLQKKVLVNLFVIDKPWLFSIFWCANVSSVTTNACHIFSEMKVPVWHLAPDTYQMIWILTDCVSCFIMLSMFLLQRYCSRRTLRAVDHDNEVLLQRLHQHLA
ncbi:glycerophosphoinositol inositolphosphodiesterase GDPD2-like [Protopterus annectens]|uniref:glycerophosphoinositol inositolphosphodiesterase GDPD2-like n=1 Tax=Protopterus annectens TaxID=7888 RepID=UPI001CF9DF32|nr:glycerophosphoinositol inositolphosphodiesterase GDPD2-like [Protopterus annectens]